MFRRNKEEFVWSFDDDFLVACSNARVALALLRCGRGVPGALTHYHNCEGVARALVPAFLKCPTLLRKALRSPLAGCGNTQRAQLRC